MREATIAIQARRLRSILPASLHPFRLLFSVLRPALPRGVRAYRARGGVLYLDVSESPTMLARALGLYEPEKHRAIKRHLREGMTFLDVGACKGDFTLFGSRLVGEAGKVVAVEPEPQNAASLRRAIARSRRANIVLYEAAVSDTDGEATLHRADPSAEMAVSSGWHSLGQVTAKRDDITVRTRSIDTLVDELQMPRMDVMKIDVEGWEKTVLEGAGETLARHRPIVFMDLHPDAVRPQEVADELRAHGYRIYRIDESQELTDLPDETTEIVARP